MITVAAVALAALLLISVVLVGAAFLTEARTALAVCLADIEREDHDAP